jgi:hypothetical protein
MLCIICVYKLCIFYDYDMYTMHITQIYILYTGKLDSIYMVYAMHMLCILYVYTNGISKLNMDMLPAGQVH